MDYTEIYNKYKKAVEIQNIYNDKNLKDVHIRCSQCGSLIHFNGVSSQNH